MHAEDVVDFLQFIKQQQSAVVGPHISSLPLLNTLTLDFASDGDLQDLQGYNAIRNRFEWLKTHETSNKLVAAPIFPSLERIDVLNLPPLRTGPFDFDEALPAAGAGAIPLRTFFFQTGHNMRSPLAIASLFTAVPSLVDYRVEYQRGQPTEGAVLPSPRPIKEVRDFESQFVFLENGSMLCHYARKRGGRDIGGAAAAGLTAAEE